MRLDLRAPTPEMIHVEDIARGLSRLCRWSGQCDWFYSVAQHSVLVAGLVSRPHRLQALLHDAPEAFIGDMPRPLKDLCPDFRVVEARLWAVIAERFGVDVEIAPEVKHADDVLLVTERRDLMPRAPEWGWDDAPAPLAPGNVKPWPAGGCYGVWMKEFRRLQMP